MHTDDMQTDDAQQEEGTVTGVTEALDNTKDADSAAESDELFKRGVFTVLTTAALPVLANVAFAKATKVMQSLLVYELALFQCAHNSALVVLANVRFVGVTKVNVPLVRTVNNRTVTPLFFNCTIAML